MFDYESLTLGEVAFIESQSHQSISAIASEEAPKGNALAAIVTVIKRRNGEPGYKFNEALKVSLKEATALLGIGEEETEEEGEADASGENENE
jgi:hypothetical protein